MTARSTNLAIAALVVALTGFFWWISSKGPKFEWEERFRDENEQPYDLTILSRLLKNYFPGQNFTEIKQKLATEVPAEGRGKTYILVGEGMLIDSTDAGRLVGFVRSGGTAFLATKTLPTAILRELMPDSCARELAFMPDYTSVSRDSVSFNFLDKALIIKDLSPFIFVHKNKPERYSWAVFDSSMTCPGDLAQRDLGSLEDSLVNFLEWRCGDGRFLLHTDPVAFCNYFLLKKNGQQYAAGVLSHLQPSEILWDERNRTTEDIARRRNDRDGGEPAPPGESPLAYILKQPALAWSWYLMLGLAGAFVFFRGKRRQRIIPVLPKLENTSLDFVKTIGQLAFRQQNQSQLCQQNMKLFLGFLRERYGLAATQLDPGFFQQISAVSQVPVSEVEAIFAQFQATESNLADEKTLVAFYRGIERFYQICK